MRLSTPLKALGLSLMLACLAPSAGTSYSAAVAATSSVTDANLDAMKNDLIARLQACQEELSQANKELQSKATTDEAPDLYKEYEYIRSYIEEAYMRVQSATTESDLIACISMISDIQHRIVNLQKEIDAYTGSYVFTATTVEGVEMTFKIVSEDDKTCQVGSGAEDSRSIAQGTTGSVTIPSTVNGYRVVALAPYAFYMCRTVTSVVMPESITTIGEYCFFGCRALATAEIPESVTEIGTYAFSFCYPLQTSIPEKLQTLGGAAFRGTAITSATIPASLNSIGYNPFMDCASLTVITVDEGNTKYDSRGDCNAIVETATNTLVSGCKTTTIPGTVTKLGHEAFYGSGLTSLSVPKSLVDLGSGSVFHGCDLASIVVEEGNPQFDSRGGCNAIIATASNELRLGCKNTTFPTDVTSIGVGAFYGSTIASVDIPATISTIGDEAFYSCEQLASATIPASVTEIGSMVFQDCTSLVAVNLPNTLTSIGFQAFASCESLKSVTLPASIKSIGYSFIRCGELKDVYCYAEEVPSADRYAFGSQGSKTLHVPAASIEAYKAATPWKDFGEIVAIEGGEVASEPYAVVSEDGQTLTFYYDAEKANRGGKSVDPVTANGPDIISEWYDYRSRRVKTVVFDDSFADCTSITSTERWFFGCTNLESVIGLHHLNTENVTDMESMFYNCPKLASLDLSGFNTEKVTSMNSMFAECSSLNNVDLSSFDTQNVTIMYSMFRGCSSLTSLNLSSFNTANVIDMGSMFSGCTNLKTIYADDEKWTNSAIGKDYVRYLYTFEDCTSLVGGYGTKYDASHVNAEYARIDKPGQPGYLTQKNVVDGIHGIATKATSDNGTWYTLDGRRIQGEPQSRGIYVRDGRKVVMK